jgi:selenocysteine lyase/cysteine desulfurase
VEFLASLAPGESRRACLQNVFTDLRARGKELFAKLWQGLGEIPSVRLYGPPPSESRTPTIAFTVEGKTSAEVSAFLASEFGVFVSNGDFLASVVTERLGVAEEGLVRAGCACYTTMEEVDRLIGGVEAMR